MRSSPHGLFFLFLYFVTMSCKLETERKWARGPEEDSKINGHTKANLSAQGFLFPQQETALAD